MFPSGFPSNRCVPFSLARLAVVGCLFVFAAGCSGDKKQARIFEAGERAQVDHISYTVVDTETFPKLDNGGESRIPTNRFYVTQLSVFNGGNSDFTMPTLTLVDDTGTSYPELADGRGARNWVGVSRKLGAAETLQGTVVFDAPVKHYKLRISDEFSEEPVYINMPVPLVHDKGDLTPPPVPDSSVTFPPTPSQSLPGKK